MYIACNKCINVNFDADFVFKTKVLNEKRI